MYSSRQNNQTWGEVGLMFLGSLTLAIVLVLISAGLLSVIWKWIVPVVFQGAVRSNILPETITLLQALKLNIFLGITGLTGYSFVSIKAQSDNRIIKWLLTVLIRISLLAILTVISGLLISLVWGWVVPDVFSSAVKQGILPESLSVWHAILLSFLLSLIGPSRNAQKNNSSKEKVE